MAVTLITGIDTDVGKTYITGLMAKYLQTVSDSVITAKISQTGCDKISDDIITHRKIMGVELNYFDTNGTTCPYIFKYPASPHLAARLEGKKIEIDVINQSIDILSENFDNVLLEGVGGLYVPLNDDITLLDFAENNKFPLIIVSSSRLGSINHTLLTIEVAISRNIPIKGIVYNRYMDESKEIAEDTINVIKAFLQKKSISAEVIEVQKFDIYNPPIIDFSKILI